MSGDHHEDSLAKGKIVDLVTVTEFAKRAGVSRQAIYKALNKGRFNYTNKKINLEDPEVVEYLQRQRGGEPAPAGPPPSDGPPSVSKPKSEPANPAASKRVELENYKIGQQSLHLKMRNDETAGRLIPRDLVIAAVINPLETEQSRLLTDGCQTIAGLMFAEFKAGGTLEDCERILREQLTKFIRARKANIARLLGVRIGETIQ